MKLVSFLMRYSRSMVIVALIAGIISGVSSTGLLALINATLKYEGARTATLLWSFIALCLIVPVTRILSEGLLVRLGQGATFDLRTRLSRQILGVPLRQLEELGSHRLMAALTDDVPAIAGVVTLIPLLCVSAAVAIGCLVFLAWLSWKMLLAVLIFMALGILSYQLPILRAMKYFRTAREHADKLFQHMRALTDGIKELKLHSRRRRAFSNLFDSTASAALRDNVTGLTIYTVASSWGQLLVFVVIGLLLFVLPAIEKTSVPSLTGYTLTLLFLMTPLQVIMNSLPGLGRANVAIKNIEDLGLTLAKHPGEGESTIHQQPRGRWHSIELAGVTHSYLKDGEENNFTLGPIDLRLQPGEILFLVGGNGSGKTTLAKILTGLYIPESGEIRIDGEPVTNASRESYRQCFSVVFSDSYIFESLLGLEKADLDEQAREYLNLLQLNHKVEVKDGALSTTNLSQGQRKRLALLTAYLEDRQIYLFDEWAADQDPTFKKIFYYQLLPELKGNGKTVIVISHDDRYYHVGDRIIKMDCGKIDCVKTAGGENNIPREPIFQQDFGLISKM